jgi:outer membrane receptor protein involved in Fe transport
MKSTQPHAKYISLVIAHILTTGALSNTTYAESADKAQASGGLDEIIVTATRRQERLMDVPMSVQAFSQEKLDAEGLHNIDDLSRASPGVTFIRQGAGSAGNYNDEGSDISIRGIDSSAGASTTGIYIDETPIQGRHLNFGTLNAFPAIFDLERVEVLKGPQGTLFGSGSEGGAIRFITPEPNLHEYSGYARAELATIDHGGSNYEAGAALGGPIIDGTLAFRVSASFREDGGWVNRVSYTAPSSTLGDNYETIYSGNPTIDQVTEKHSNWHDTQTFRLALKWQPSDNLSVSPSIFVQSLHYNDTGAYWVNLSNPSSAQYNNGNIQRNPSTDPLWVAALKINWQAGPVDIVSNTSYYSRSQHSVSDYTQWYNTVFTYDQYNKSPNSAPFTDSQRNFNEEIRATSSDPASKLQWTVGAFYAHSRENSTEYIISPVGGADLPNNYVYLQPEFSMLDEQYALFGEASYKFTDTVKLIAGLRYSNLKYSGLVNETEQGSFAPLGSPGGVFQVITPASGSASPVTPRIAVNYQPNRDTLYYVSAAEGFRPGGINSRLPSNCYPTGVDPASAAKPYASDSLWQYEIGTKQTGLDNRLTVSGALYEIKWKNIQQFVYLACGLGFNYNLGEVKAEGAELEVNWKASDHLTLGVNAAYTSSKFQSAVILGNAVPSDQLVAAGDHLAASPWNVQLTSEYAWNDAVGRPYVRIDYQYSAAQTTLVPYQDAANAPNADPTLPGLPQINLLNLRAGMRIRGYDASLFIANATNFHKPLFVSRDFVGTNYGLANFDTNYFARGMAPRTIGATVTYRF